MTDWVNIEQSAFIMLDKRRYRFAICFENHLIIGMERLHFVFMWLVGAC